MPISFDPSQIWSPFVSDDSESEEESSAESDDDTDDGGTEPVTYALDPDNVPRVRVTTEPIDTSDSDDDHPGPLAQWYNTGAEQSHSHSTNSFTAQAEYGGQIELSTEAYDDLREAIREQHSGTFEGHLEQLHQDTSPRQDTLSDAI
jgi:hypothetical protein